MGNILKAEKDYLTAIQKSINNDQFAELTNKHNETVDFLAYDIDEKIYHILDLSEEQISIIESDLRMKEIYLPDIENARA